MCAGNCSGKCKCAAQTRPGKPGRNGGPGATPQLTFEFTALPAGSTPTVDQTGTDLNPNIAVGFPLAPSPVFNPVVPVTTGVTASASIDNTVPLAPQLSLVLVNGDDGENAWSFVSGSYTQPDVGDSVTVNVEHTGFISLGLVVFVTYGGYYQVMATPGATTVSLQNLGYTAPVGSYVAPGDPVPPVGPSAQPKLSAAGPRGVQGAPGTATNGLTPIIEVVYSIPVSAPVSAARNLVFYANASPPADATELIPYTWNGASWDAGPNVAGAPGSQLSFGPANPNDVPVPSSNIGDAFGQVSPNSVIFWRKTSPTLWVNQGSMSTGGSVTQLITHTSPGTQVLDLAYFSFDIQADKDVTLNWSSANFSGQGTWNVSITNNDGSPINLNITTARWEEDPALALGMPGVAIAIAAGATRVLRFVQNPVSGLYTFISNYLPSAALV